ncbi:MAG: DNA primase [Harvfovirus sp.]|uniref:DNA primase n=1 Tax=Harvfovirus sp. TaxID=2487768 RepID=A0A3G5A2W8_9VIRU|nr:MAG: DNA primase [Harvfovirus sp.]
MTKPKKSAVVTSSQEVQSNSINKPLNHLKVQKKIPKTVGCKEEERDTINDFRDVLDDLGFDHVKPEFDPNDEVIIDSEPKPRNIKDDLDILSKHNIAYRSLTLKPIKEKGSYFNEYGNLKKRASDWPANWKDITLTSKYVSTRNASMIPMGERYGLIGVDVDKKGESSVSRFESLCADNGFDMNTLTMFTMNGGAHYYFLLTLEQMAALKNLQSLDGKIFMELGFHIDVKYNNQCLFGPGIINFDGKIYEYKIGKDIPEIILPNFIFEEVLVKMGIAADKKLSPPKKLEVAPKKLEIAPKKTEVLAKMGIVADMKLSPPKKLEVAPTKTGVPLNKVNDKTASITKLKDEKIEKELRLWLDLLDVKRFHDTNDWKRVVSIIKNEGGREELAHEYSKKSSKYNYSSVHNLFMGIDEDHDSKATINSLFYWAKEDEDYSDKYKNARRSSVKYIIYYLFMYGISDEWTAHLFYSLRPDDYIFDGEEKKWYHLNKYGLWLADLNSSELKTEIADILCTPLTREYESRSMLLEAELRRNLKSTTDSDMITKMKKESERNKKLLDKTYATMLKYLDRAKDQENVVKSLIKRYSKPDLVDKFDKVAPYIFAFKNGVYDLKDNLFRKARPEEYITCTAGYDYYPKADPIIKAILMKYLLDIMPDKDELKYLLGATSRGLVGNNKLEEFYIWIGSGRNGKGLIRDMLMYALGDYFGTMPVAYILQSDSKYGTNPNAPDDIMYQNRKKRVVVVTEAPKNAKLACDKIKSWSGQDPVRVRTLNKESGKPFVPQFKLILQTNCEVEIEGGEVAMRKRFKCIGFQYVFTENPIKPNEKLLDDGIKELISEPAYKLAFFEILLDHYKEFIQNGGKLAMPPRIKKDTEDYLNDNDPISRFVEDTLEVTNSDKDTIEARLLFESFQGSLDPNQRTNWRAANFKSALANKGIKWKHTKTGNVYVGIKFPPTKCVFANEPVPVHENDPKDNGI